MPHVQRQRVDYRCCLLNLGTKRDAAQILRSNAPCDVEPLSRPLDESLGGGRVCSKMGLGYDGGGVPYVMILCSRDRLSLMPVCSMLARPHKVIWKLDN
jgi:hypothetical protein